ncbi:MAG: ABC transporter substrate-binding protein [Chloroflexi bacterium]|nr:ABC transporter substrate-binding protein [Chloroflexota bacterium]
MRRPIIPLLILSLLLMTACGNRETAGTSPSGGNAIGRIGMQQGLAEGNSYITCPRDTNRTAARPESGTITLTVSGWTSSPAEDALVRADLQKFQQAHPNMRLKWTPITTGDYPTNISADFSGGNAPDVFYLRPDMTSDYISNAKLLNLSPYMLRDNVQASAYYPSLITPFTCKSGEVYGIPKDWNTLGVFYNKKLFQNAGLAFPADNWTWNDMRADAKKLTKPGKIPIYGITLPGDASRWLAFLFANGGSVLNRDGTQATFNDKAGVDALNFYVSFQKEDGSSVLPSDVIATTWQGADLEAFARQRAAMAIEGGWLIPYMADFPEVQYGVAPLPIAPSGKHGNLIFTNAWSAASSTKYPEAAWELIKYMTGQDVQASQLHAGFALPSLKSLANDPYFTQHPEVKVLFDAESYGISDYFGPQDTFIHDRLNLAIANVLSGNVDAQTALNSAAKQVNKNLQS